MDALWLDLKYGCRSLLKRPGFAALAVLTLALGLGVNAVAFTAIDALLLRPFHMRDGDRAGWIMFARSGDARGPATIDEFKSLVSATTAFESIAAEGRLPVSLRTERGGEQAWALLISSNYLQTIGARPALGRLFSTTDLQASDLPAVVSHRFWTDRLGAPSSLGGLTIVVNGRSFAVVGVMPDDFQGIGGLFAPDMWLPLERIDVLDVPERVMSDPWLTMFGRLRQTASVAQADAELTAVTARFPVPGADARELSGRFYPLKNGHPDLGEIRTGVWFAFGAVAVVLLIACFNVAALLMARAAERQKEIAIRCAVGANRWRILRQLCVEGLLLAIAGGAAALLVANWSGALLATFSLPAPIPQRLHLKVNGTLLIFTAAMVVVGGILPAILPALQATRASLVRSMRMESALGGRPSRTRSAFVVLQIAGATLFVVAASLFVRSFTTRLQADPRFDTQHTVAVELSPSLYGYDLARSQTFFETLQSRLAALPAVRHVALGDRVPFYVGFTNSVKVSAGAPCTSNDCRRATAYSVGRGYFEALGVPLRAGRDFTGTEMRSGGVAIVSERLASDTWPGQSPLGRTLRIGDGGTAVQVVGVAADYVHRSVSEPPAGYLYVPLRDDQYGQALTVIVRTHGDPAPMLNTVREQIRALDASLPASQIATLAERMKMPEWMPRTTAGFFLICGTLALTLATVGLFGVMYYTVSQRTREFGIRAALGASRVQVVSVVVREGLRLAVPGVLLGLAGGFMLGRLLARMLFGVAPADPLSFGGTALLQVIVALLACALPAYRATRADPITALRAD
jgi:predicted permease